MPPTLSELKVTPSFCFPFKIPDDLTATSTYKHAIQMQCDGDVSVIDRFFKQKILFMFVFDDFR